MVEGLLRGLTLDLLSLSISPKVTPSHCMHKCTAEAYFSNAVGFFHVGVVLSADALLELQPAIPAASVLLVCSFGNALVPGHLCASDATQEVYF